MYGTCEGMCIRAQAAGDMRTYVRTYVLYVRTNNATRHDDPRVVNGIYTRTIKRSYESRGETRAIKNSESKRALLSGDNGIEFVHSIAERSRSREKTRDKPLPIPTSRELSRLSLPPRAGGKYRVMLDNRSRRTSAPRETKKRGSRGCSTRVVGPLKVERRGARAESQALGERSGATLQFSPFSEGSHPPSLPPLRREASAGQRDRRTGGKCGVSEARDTESRARSRAIGYFAFRCYSKIVANRRPRDERHRRSVPLLPLHPSLSLPPSRGIRGGPVPASALLTPTRCFINENEGASYIFLTRGVGRPSSAIPLLSSRRSSPPPCLLFRRSSRRCFHSARRSPPRRQAFSLSLLSPRRRLRRHFHHCSRR